jgi:hypothetical protein
VPGEWLASEAGRRVYHIGRVQHLHRAMSSPKPRLLLTVARYPAASLPADAVLHPWDRTMPPDPTAPQAVRIRQEGATAVMRMPKPQGPAARNPDAPAARWRSYCPLRRLLRQAGSSVTVEHVLAADHLRLLVDLATLGTGAPRGDGEPHGMMSGPVLGPSVGAVAQAHAAADVDRALGRFAAGQRELLVAVVLRSMSVQAWCDLLGARQSGHPPNARVEMGRLLACLDLLAEHFTDAVAAGRRDPEILACL